MNSDQLIDSNKMENTILEFIRMRGIVSRRDISVFVADEPTLTEYGLEELLNAMWFEEKLDRVGGRYWTIGKSVTPSAKELDIRVSEMERTFFHLKNVLDTLPALVMEAQNKLDANDTEGCRELLARLKNLVDGQ